jgi:hypothetical protein
VDLNKVLSNLVVLGADSKRIEHVAGLRLQVESTIPVRKVQSLGDWSLTWGRASATITFVFPHRRDELQAYADHITELFGAINPLYHSQVIFYDQSVCARTSCRQDMLLSDIGCFEDLCTMHKVSETAPPVPCVPEYELNNTAAATTIHEHPELFQIVTPINVDRFQYLLHSHPNQALVLSVCKGFREGFWPWADTSKPNYPITWDNAHRPISDPSHQQFLRNQCDEEIRLKQYSPSFGMALLPGMYSMPLSRWAVLMQLYGSKA